MISMKTYESPDERLWGDPVLPNETVYLRERTHDKPIMWVTTVRMKYTPPKHFFCEVWLFHQARTMILEPFYTLDDAVEAANNAMRLDIGGWKLHRANKLHFKHEVEGESS